MNQNQIVKHILQKEWDSIYQISGEENITDLIARVDVNDPSKNHLESIEGGDSLDLQFALEFAIQAITLIKLCIEVYNQLPKVGAQELVEAIREQYSVQIDKLEKVRSRLPQIAKDLVAME